MPSGPRSGLLSPRRIFSAAAPPEFTFHQSKQMVPAMNEHSRSKSLFRSVVGLAVLLAGAFYVLTQKMNCMNGGAGPAINGAPAGANPVAQPVTEAAKADSQSKPLEITIDDAKYFVGDTPVESTDELVKMAQAVPKGVTPPRVRIIRKPTARYSAEKNLSDALQAAKVDFVLEK